MYSQFRTALVMLVIMTAITGAIYPSVVTGIAQVIFPRQANGSQVFLVAPFGNLALSVQRSRIERFEPGTDQSGIDRCRYSPHQSAAGRRS